MSSQNEPWVGSYPCVTITAKKFKLPGGKREPVELHTLRKGESMVFSAVAGQIVTLKVVVIATKSAYPTKLFLNVGP